MSLLTVKLWFLPLLLAVFEDASIRAKVEAMYNAQNYVPVTHDALTKRSFGVIAKQTFTISGNRRNEMVQTINIH